MVKQMKLMDEARNAVYVTLAYVLASSVVTWLVVPVQQMFIPEVTLFAALIFPPHGVRVLSAWLFGWRSIIYLYIAVTVTHFVLTPDLPLGSKAFIAWGIVSCCAALAFALLRLIGQDYRTLTAEPGRHAWRGLLMVGFLSSILNSLGHNLLFAAEIWPVGSLKVFVAFLVGDTLGTFVAFFGLMMLLRSLRRFA